VVRQAASSGLFGSAQLVVGHVGDEAAEWSFLLEQRAAELVLSGRSRKTSSSGIWSNTSKVDSMPAVKALSGVAASTFRAASSHMRPRMRAVVSSSSDACPLHRSAEVTPSSGGGASPRSPTRLAPTGRFGASPRRHRHSPVAAAGES
jgi:hypothetical protein